MRGPAHQKVKADAQEFVVPDGGFVFCPEERFSGFPVQQFLPGHSVQHVFCGRVVGTADGVMAQGEELLLEAVVFLVGLVFVAADVVGRNVGEDAAAERNAVHPVPFDAERGHFHNDRFHAVVRHFPQEFLGLIGLRRRVDRGRFFVPPLGARRADEAGLAAGVVQHGPHNIGNGGLALGAGHADDLEVAGRVPEQVVGHECQRHAGVFGHGHQGNVLLRRAVPGSGKVRQMLTAALQDECAAAVVIGHPGIFVSVGLRPGHAHKYGVRRGFAGVVNDVGNVHCGRVFAARYRQSSEHVLEGHPVTFFLGVFQT